jgi:cholestenol delta-isomerase
MEYSLGIFAGIAIAVALISTLTINQKQNISKTNKIVFVWLIITGSIHLFVEGYFACFHETLQSDNSLIGQWWKEYSLSDSRYLSSDSFVLSMERITAVIANFKKNIYIICILVCSHNYSFFFYFTIY